MSARGTHIRYTWESEGLGHETWFGDRAEDCALGAFRSRRLGGFPERMLWRTCAVNLI